MEIYINKTETQTSKTNKIKEEEEEEEEKDKTTHRNNLWIASVSRTEYVWHTAVLSERRGDTG